MSKPMMAGHAYQPDPGTAERLVAGRLDADDAPPGYRRVAALLSAAGTAPLRGASGSTDIGAMTTALRELHDITPIPSRRTHMLSNLVLAKAVAAVAAVTISGSAAAAATGHLPTSLQNKVANAVEHVSVNLPGGDDAPDAADNANTDANDKGEYISGIAHETYPTGAEKGAAISDAANGDHSRAGDHGAPESNPAGVDAPSSGGIGTAGDPNGNAVANANDAASEGSTNAGDHPTASDHSTADDHPSGRP